MIARLTMLFGALALLLATVGLYGVTAYTVARRTAEIGIRMALGAERGSVIAMVMRGALHPDGLGLAIGIPVALVCVRFVKAQLYEITNADASVMAVRDCDAGCSGVSGGLDSGAARGFDRSDAGVENGISARPPRRGSGLSGNLQLERRIIAVCPKE